MYRNTLTTITAIFSLTINLVFTQVVINEIHYNPGSAQGSDSDFEFLELYNPGTTDIDISGYSFTQGSHKNLYLRQIVHHKQFRKNYILK